MHYAWKTFAFPWKFVGTDSPNWGFPGAVILCQLVPGANLVPESAKGFKLEIHGDSVGFSWKKSSTEVGVTTQAFQRLLD